MTLATTQEPAGRRLARQLLGVIGRVERRLRPDDAAFVDPAAVTSAVAVRPARHDDTVELLRPDTAEPPAVRARRQARAYLDRRRDKLAEDLDGTR